MPNKSGWDPGSRVKVWSKDLTREIGPATVLDYEGSSYHGKERRLLLDSGKEIMNDQCWDETDFGIHTMRAFEMELPKKIRVFEKEHGRIGKSEYYLKAGDRVRIEGFESAPYDHISWLFARITYKGGDPVYLAVRELKFPSHFPKTVAKRA